MRFKSLPAMSNSGHQAKRLRSKSNYQSQTMVNNDTPPIYPVPTSQVMHASGQSTDATQQMIPVMVPDYY